MIAGSEIRTVPKPPPGVESVCLRVDPAKREVSIVVRFTDPDVYKAIDKYGVAEFMQRMKSLVYPEAS